VFQQVVVPVGGVFVFVVASLISSSSFARSWSIWCSSKRVAIVFITWQMYAAMRVQFCRCFGFVFSFWAWFFAKVKSSCRAFMVSSLIFCVSIFTSALSFWILFFNILLRLILTNSSLPPLGFLCD